MSGQSVDLGSDRFAGHGDDFYALLMQAHDELSFEESAAFNARLVLILANQVGDPAVLKQAVDRAAESSGAGE